jgi:hypothetical protein
MRRKAPGERFKTLTASIPPELYDAFVSRAEQDRINKSELVKSWVEAWLSGTPIQSGESSPSPAIDLEQLKQEIKTEVLNSLVTVSPEPKPEAEQEAEARKVTPEQEHQGEEPQRPVMVEGDRVKIEVVRDYLSYHIKKYQVETGKKPADIAREVLNGKKGILTSILTPESANQKAMSEAEFKALEALVVRRQEKPSSEGT